MNRRAAIFDLDGTLLDTLDDLADSGNHVLAECGFPTHPVEDYRTFVGEGVGVLIRRILPESNRDKETMLRIGAMYREEYGRRWNAKSKPYDGIGEMLDALTDRGVRMAVLSNKPDVFTQQCVDGLLADWQFDIVMGHHDGIARKPDPAGAPDISRQWKTPPEQIVYVGDTATDMQTAKAAGMFAVGVRWGFRSEEELLENGADVIIGHPTELLELCG